MSPARRKNIPKNTLKKRSGFKICSKRWLFGIRHQPKEEPEGERKEENTHQSPPCEDRTQTATTAPSSSYGDTPKNTPRALLFEKPLPETVRKEGGPPFKNKNLSMACLINGPFLSPRSFSVLLKVSSDSKRSLPCYRRGDPIF